MTLSHKIVPVGDIVVTDDHIREIGDLEGLAGSIGDIGLLHDIGITPDLTLVFGWRRLKALESLGHTHASCKILHNAQDLLTALKMEDAENAFRKDKTAAEKVAMGKRIEAAMAGMLHGKVVAGKKADEKQTAVAVAAEAVGMGTTTYKKAKAVVAAAEADPEANGHLVEKMDTESVGAAFAALKAEAESPPATLIKSAKIYFTKGFVKATDGQMKAFAEFDPELQADLLESIRQGKQTIAQAIESGAVPEQSIEETIKFRNIAIENLCKEIANLATKRIEELSSGDPWIHYQNRHSSALAKITSFCEILRTLKCGGPCPKCNAQGCNACLHTGRMPKAVLQTLG